MYGDAAINLNNQRNLPGATLYIYIIEEDHHTSLNVQIYYLQICRDTTQQILHWLYHFRLLGYTGGIT
jgi:hypothetical protein